MSIGQCVGQVRRTAAAAAVADIAVQTHTINQRRSTEAQAGTGRKKHTTTSTHLILLLLVLLLPLRRLLVLLLLAVLLLLRRLLILLVLLLLAVLLLRRRLYGMWLCHCGPKHEPTSCSNMAPCELLQT